MLADKRGRRLSGVGIDVAAKLLACLRWRHRHRHGLQQLKRRRGLDVEGLAQRLQRGLSLKVSSRAALAAAWLTPKISACRPQSLKLPN